ncbi:MAG TPA: hypothetical protein HA362_02410 [Nanoarchaeota archaeon]|nr:hypothetical protein [Nanoarchaeota archaeon]
MDPELIKDIGLTNSEIAVYTALLKLGSVKVGDLMKQISLHRSRIYEAINRLSDKGLVSYVIRNNVKYFEASDPERLITQIQEQKEKLNEKEKSIKKIIPELKKQVSSLMPHSEAHVFIGKEGFKTVRNDVLKQNQDIYLIGAIGKENRVLKYFFANFERTRIQNNIKWHVLFDSKLKNKKITKLPLMEARFLPKEYSSPAVINIYADRVVNVLWKGDNPICFMIINKEIADSYKKWFGLLWKYSN